MKKSTLCAILAAVVVSTVLALPAFAAVGHPLGRMRVDATSRDRSQKKTRTFTAASVDTFWVGFPAEIISIQNVTADVTIQPLGDPNCLLVSTKVQELPVVHNIANPAAGSPCVDWGPTLVVAGKTYNFGNGGMIAYIVTGAGSNGSCDVICVSRGQR